MLIKRIISRAAQRLGVRGAGVQTSGHHDACYRPATAADAPCGCGRPVLVVFATEFGTGTWCGA